MSAVIRRPWFAAACAVALAGCMPAPRTAPPPRPTGPAPDVAISRLERDLAVPEGRVRIRIRNAFGDVHVRNSNTRAVGLLATIQRIGAEAPEVDVRLDRRGAADVRVEPVVAGLEDGCRDLSADGWRRARVDLTVFVPPNVEIDAAATCDGRITAKGIKGDFVARTDSGSIDAGAIGRLDVESRSGVVRARQSSGKWRGESRMVSHSGTVVATVPVFGPVALDARGCGELKSAIDVERAERAGCWRARARFGAATQVLRVESGTGVVELRRMDEPAN